MDEEKRKRLEAAGWRVGDADEFLECGCATGDVWIAVVALLAIAIPVIIGLIVWFVR